LTRAAGRVPAHTAQVDVSLENDCTSIPNAVDSLTGGRRMFVQADDLMEET